jgi:hypothetical protein
VTASARRFDAAIVAYGVRRRKAAREVVCDVRRHRHA